MGLKVPFLLLKLIIAPRDTFYNKTVWGVFGDVSRVSVMLMSPRLFTVKRIIYLNSNNQPRFILTEISSIKCREGFDPSWNFRSIAHGTLDPGLRWIWVGSRGDVSDVSQVSECNADITLTFHI